MPQHRVEDVTAWSYTVLVQIRQVVGGIMESPGQVGSLGQLMQPEPDAELVGLGPDGLVASVLKLDVEAASRRGSYGEFRNPARLVSLYVEDDLVADMLCGEVI